jgi:glyoxylase I family protein
MAKIKHIAISTQDPDAACKFYTETMGLKVVGQVNSASATGFFVSDGNVNIALLKFNNDDAAGKEKGKDYSGLHHIGFQVESTEEVSKQMQAVGIEPRADINQALAMGTAGARGGSHEFKFAAPDGVTIDISEVGWAGTSG